LNEGINFTLECVVSELLDGSRSDEESVGGDEIFLSWNTLLWGVFNLI
jgi:hypothetical protein